MVPFHRFHHIITIFSLHSSYSNIPYERTSSKTLERDYSPFWLVLKSLAPTFDSMSPKQM